MRATALATLVVALGGCATAAPGRAADCDERVMRAAAVALATTLAIGLADIASGDDQSDVPTSSVVFALGLPTVAGLASEAYHCGRAGP